MSNVNRTAVCTARILLVEDDSTLSMIISETLQRDGFEVVTACNGVEGLQKFTSTEPTL